MGLAVLWSQAGAEGCGSPKPEGTPATQPAAKPPPPEGQREPVPAPADPKPRVTQTEARWIFFDTTVPGAKARIRYGFEPGEMLSEYATLPAKRIVHVPVGPFGAVVAEGTLDAQGGIRCRIFDPETQMDTARQPRKGFKEGQLPSILCLERRVS